MGHRKSDRAAECSPESVVDTAVQTDVTGLLSGAGKAIPLFKVHMPESVLRPLAATLLSEYIGQGPRVTEFERALAPWVGSQNVLTVNSGTSALHLALRLAQAGTVTR
jgi:hypothetical protein